MMYFDIQCDYLIHEGDSKKNKMVAMFQLNTENICYFILEGPFIKAIDLLTFVTFQKSCGFLHNIF